MVPVLIELDAKWDDRNFKQIISIGYDRGKISFCEDTGHEHLTQTARVQIWERKASPRTVRQTRLFLGNQISTIRSIHSELILITTPDNKRHPFIILP